MTKTTRFALDGTDVRILHDAVLALREEGNHAWEEQRLNALLIQLMNAAQRLGVKVEV